MFEQFFDLYCRVLSLHHIFFVPPLIIRVHLITEFCYFVPPPIYYLPENFHILFLKSNFVPPLGLILIFSWRIIIALKELFPAVDNFIINELIRIRCLSLRRNSFFCQHYLIKYGKELTFKCWFKFVEVLIINFAIYTNTGFTKWNLFRVVSLPVPCPVLWLMLLLAF